MLRLIDTCYASSMPVNPRSLVNLVNLPRLESGVTSEVHRVRAAAEVQAWFKAMTAEQRGELLASVMVLNVPARTSAGEKPQQSAQVPSRGSDSLGGIRVLTVAAVTLPSRLKNSLRWSPQRYTDLEAVLRSTKTVCLDKSNGKLVWRVDNGDPMRKDTVLRLFDAGVLLGK